MLSKITQTFNYIREVLNYLSKNPFEAGELVEVREEIEYEERAPLEAKEVKTPHLPAELIGEIIKQIKDPIKIANVILVSKTWYKEGRHRLYEDREEIMEWLRLKRIEKLDSFIRCLYLDRLDEYTRIYKNLREIRKGLMDECNKARINYINAADKLPATYFEYGYEDEETNRILKDVDEKIITFENTLDKVSQIDKEIEKFKEFIYFKTQIYQTDIW